MSATKSGRSVSESTRAKIAASLMGRPQSAESRARKSAAMKGRPFTQAHKDAVRAGKRAQVARDQTESQRIE